MTTLLIISFIGAFIIFIALIILGPDNKISKWLFPVGVILTVLTLSVQQEWISVTWAIIFYGFIYLVFVRKKTNKS
jgi:hypothetical protein